MEEKRQENQQAVPAALLPPAPAPPRQEPLTAESELAGYIKSLTDSGLPSKELTRDCSRVVDDWKQIAKTKKLVLQFGKPTCHRDGCYVEMVYPSSVLFDVTNSALSGSEVLSRWPGSRFRSGPIPSSNGVRATWVLFTR